jgi:hypothetical protein
VLANTADLQAAEMNGWAGMAFYQSGRVPSAGFGVVSAGQPCLVLLRRDPAGALKISVSDPTTRLAEATISVGSQGLTIPLPQGESAGATVTRTLRP